LEPFIKIYPFILDSGSYNLEHELVAHDFFDGIFWTAVTAGKDLFARHVRFLKNPDDIISDVHINLLIDTHYPGSSDPDVICEDISVLNTGVPPSPSVSIAAQPTNPQPTLSQIAPKESTVFLKNKAGKNDVAKKVDIKKQEKDIAKISIKNPKQELENTKEELNGTIVANLRPFSNKVEEIEEKVL
jgi:hypothetical protein